MSDDNRAALANLAELVFSQEQGHPELPAEDPSTDDPESVADIDDPMRTLVRNLFHSKN